MDCESMASRKRAQRMSLGMCLGIALGAIAAAAGDAVAQAPPPVNPAISGSRDGWRREARIRSAPRPVQGQGGLPAPPPGGPAGGAPLVPEFRTYDGSGNNIQNPLWGTPGVNYLREGSGARYADGKSAPAGANRPSARVISNALVAQGDVSTADDRGLSTCLYEFGQFLDHDIGLAAGGSTEAFDISVPAGDPWFDPASTGTKKIWMDRSAFNPATGTNNPREQINTVTSFIDGSQIYGVNSARAAWLRAGTGRK